MNKEQITRDQILAMEAGAELEKLIAEQVMGWTMYHYDKDYEENCYYLLMDGWDAVNPLSRGYKTEEEAWKDNKPWSTDISAAMEVAEKFDSWEITKMVVGIRDYKASVNEDPNAVAYADTASLAICRAALLTLIERG